MEFLPIIIWLLVGIIPCGIFCILAKLSLKYWPGIRDNIGRFSVFIAVLSLVEIVLIGTLGAKPSYAMLGHSFTILHFFVLIFGPPCIALLLLQVPIHQRWVRYLLAPLGCWIIGLAGLLLHMTVNEDIAGIDSGEPFFLISPDHIPN